MALTNEDLKAIGQLLDNSLHPINERLDKMDIRLNNIEDRLGNVEDRLGNVEDRLNKTDIRLDKLEGRIAVMEMKQDITSKKLDDLKLDVKIAERDIRRDLHKLDDEMETVLELLKQHELLPL